MSSNSDDFFPIPLDPRKKPQKPDPINDDWSDDDIEEKCSNCGHNYSHHTPNQALFCVKLIIGNSLGENHHVLF
jgi:hypothetical protein